jgi:hypothetical protein
VPGVPASAPAASLAVGTLVQAHFLGPEGKAVVIVVDTTTTSTSRQLAKREGTSIRGEVQRVKARSVSVRIHRGSRDVVMDDRTTLVDREGHVRGTGVKSIAPLLASGTDVLVTWVPYFVMDGEGGVSSNYRRALEIRTLSPATE